MAWWEKKAVSWCKGDNYKIIADDDCDANLMITFCLIWRCLRVVVLAVIVGGCYNQVLLNTDSIGDATTGDIVVSTRDGRKVSFSSGSYSIVTDTTGRKVVKGTGRMQPRLSAPDEPFVGQIPIDEVESIHCLEKSTLFYFSVVAGVAATAVVIILVIALSGGASAGG